MKHAVSISIGSSKRDKSVEVELLGEKVLLERIGTDGDMERAAELFKEMDGKVDAFGVGGTDLGILVDRKWYPLHSVHSLIRHVKITPVVDGCGLKTTLEKQVAGILTRELGKERCGKKALVIAACDRWGMAHSFTEANYECLFGDLMFTLGLPIPIRSEQGVRRAAALLMPIAGRIPFKWVYPTGQEQEKRKPKWEQEFLWADVISGDCHYIKRAMPERMEGKIIVTNTTTREDVAFFKQCGVKYLMTTTPVLDGRSFGTNMMEAAIVAACGRKQPIDYSQADYYMKELEQLLFRLDLKPQLQELN